MIPITAAGVLGIASPALTIGRGAPQAGRLLRSSAAGVSVATWIQALLLGELWAAYGFFAHVQAEVVTNIPGAVLAIVVVVLVGIRTGTTSRVLALASACGALAGVLIVASAGFQGPLACVGASRCGCRRALSSPAREALPLCRGCRGLPMSCVLAFLATSS